MFGMWVVIHFRCHIADYTMIDIWMQKEKIESKFLLISLENLDYITILQIKIFIPK